MADEGDIQALERVRIDIEKQLERLSEDSEVERQHQGQRRQDRKEIRLSEKGLNKLVSNAEKTLRALNVELVNEAEEVRTPVRLSSMPPRGW